MRVANENSNLRVKVKMLENEIANLKNEARVQEGKLQKAQDKEARIADRYKARLFGVKSLIESECNPSKFSRMLVGSDLRVSSSFFERSDCEDNE